MNHLFQAFGEIFPKVIAWKLFVLIIQKVLSLNIFIRSLKIWSWPLMGFCSEILVNLDLDIINGITMD